jgi:hypothetical protein
MINMYSTGKVTDHFILGSGRSGVKPVWQLEVVEDRRIFDLPAVPCDGLQFLLHL